jgi:serine/threonine protein kinase
MAVDAQRLFALLRDAEACPDDSALQKLLDRECADNRELRERVEGMLRSRRSPTRVINPSPEFLPMDLSAPPLPERTQAVAPGTMNPFGLPFVEPTNKLGSMGRIGHYEIQQILGSGGFGVVLKAHDEVLHRVVALKIISPVMAANDVARQRFLREARAAAAIRHVNVVQVYAVQETPTPYLVMEFIPGKTLQQLLDQRGALPLKETLLIGSQIALGLAASHQRGMIHRDIKPANILIEGDEDPVVKITDFGLARNENDPSLTQVGMVAGTPMYMAPEQARGEKMDARSDLFSLGSVLYYMVCGQPPFVSGTALGTMRGVTEGAPTELESLIPETPRWLSDMIRKLHEKNPDDRYSSASDVATILKRRLVELDGQSDATEVVRGIPAKVPSDPSRQSVEVPSPPVWWRWLILPGLILIAFLICELTGVTHFFSGKSSTPSIVVETKNDKDKKIEEKPKVEPKDANPKEFVNPIGFKFVLVGKGEFRSGGFDGMVGDQVVKLDDFYIGVYEVTHSDWDKVMGAESNPGAFRRQGREPQRVADLTDEEIARLPVNALSLAQARRFVQRLNEKFPDPEWKYALPTPLQWEYACRGGPNRPPEADGASYILSKPTNVITTNDANILKKLERTMPVGSFPPNPLGLYDMHGNVAEYTVESETIRSFRLMGGYFAEVYPTRCQARYTGFGAEDDNRAGYAQGIRLVRVKK